MANPRQKVHAIFDALQRAIYKGDAAKVEKLMAALAAATQVAQ